MLGKIIGAFHFTVAFLGTEILSVSLFTEDDQATGDWWEEDEDDDDDDDEDPGDEPDPTDAMLDTLNEIIGWEGQP